MHVYELPWRGLEWTQCIRVVMSWSNQPTRKTLSEPFWSWRLLLKQHRITWKALRDGPYPGTCNLIRAAAGYQQYSSCVTLKVITFYCHKLERGGSLIAALTVSNLAGVSQRHWPSSGQRRPVHVTETLARLLTVKAGTYLENHPFPMPELAEKPQLHTTNYFTC